MMWSMTDKSMVLEYPRMKSLRQKCYSIVQSKQGEQSLFLIYPSDYYFQLFANNSQELVDIVVAMADIIAKGEGEVANNQITLQNICRIREKEFKLFDWGCSAVRETIKTRDVSLTKIHQPYSRERNKWLLLPEYLAPQLLRAIELETYEHLWGQKGAIGSCDVW